jgi:hypothetical protein
MGLFQDQNPKNPKKTKKKIKIIKKPKKINIIKSQTKFFSGFVKRDQKISTGRSYDSLYKNNISESELLLRNFLTSSSPH